MKKVVFAPAVDIALRSLDPAGVRRVHAWFDYLKRWDEDEVVRKNSRSLPGHEGVYVLRTPTDIWIFFTMEDDTITILDVAQKSAILASGGMRIGGASEVAPLSGGKKGQ